jgi:hypothetical protein
MKKSKINYFFVSMILFMMINNNLMSQNIYNTTIGCSGLFCNQKEFYLISTMGETITGYKKTNEDKTIIIEGFFFPFDVANSTKPQEISGITVYPNPAKNKFFIVNNANIDINVLIVDVSGEIIKKLVLKSNSIMNVTNTPSGIYIIQICDEKGNCVLTKKQIVI